MSTSTDVVVVGAGLAGLSAARHLVDAGLSVVVLEARDRVGGRTHSIDVNGSRIDVGGQWIGPGQKSMYALVEELGLETHPTPVGGRQILDRAGKVSGYAGTIPKLGPIHLVQLQWALTLINRVSGRVPPDRPWDTPDAAELDAITVDAWVRKWIPSSEVRALLRPTMRTVLGADPGEISLLHFAWYVSSAGGFMPLVDVENGFQQDRIVGGAQTVSERLADKVGRDNIHLNTPVRAVHRDDDGVTVEADGKSWRARRVIVAAPLGLLDRIRWEPMLPPMRDQLHQRCPVGATVKVFAAYKESFWRKKGLSGEAVCTEGPISVVFDNTAPDGKPMLLAFVTGTPARGWSERDPKERVGEVLKLLASYYGDDALTPDWTHEQDWSTEPWSGGCPVTQFPPGTLSVFGPSLRKPVGRVHWAGTETAERCTGFMEGAVVSGERAAAEVLMAGKR